MLNAHQKRALAVLEQLLAWDAEKYDDSSKPKGKRSKKKALVKFLPSYALPLPWLHRQEEWAPDWCDGWFFRPDYAHARALGVTLATRARIAGIYVDENIKPIQEEDKEGRPLFTDKKKFPVYKKLFKFYLEWAQSTAFGFRENYTIHAAKNDTWEKQRKNNPLSIVILASKEAVPATKHAPRDPGQVTFALCRRGVEYERGQQITMTQDDFVRYLITGPEDA